VAEKKAIIYSILFPDVNCIDYAVTFIQMAIPFFANHMKTHFINYHWGGFQNNCSFS